VTAPRTPRDDYVALSQTRNRAVARSALIASEAEMPLSVPEIVELYKVRGSAQYGGEALSQLEHALQCAHHAEQAGAGEALVAACLLHDLGHLLARDGASSPANGDDLHQFLPVPFLRGAFSDAVLEPIRLHVDAKRHLCSIEPAYYDTLSPASKRSLALQGGPFSALEAKAFAKRMYAEDAVRLRRWDDLAKVPGLAMPGIDSYKPLLEGLAL